MKENSWGNLKGVRPTKPVHKLLDKGADYEAAWREMNQQHGIGRDKFELLWRVSLAERPVLMESSDPFLFSIYIGIPFCPSRCLYCSFPSHSLKELGEFRQGFVEALLLEINSTGKQTREAGMRAYSIYIGGGTPTALLPEEMDLILKELRDAFPGKWHELTVEAGRPDTLNECHLKVLTKWQVDRISINPQTMHNATLEKIGRCHTAEDIGRAVKQVRRAGIKSINMDIIIGLPGEDADMVKDTVRQVIDLGPENITLHVFSQKRGSRFSELRHQFILPPAGEAVAMHNTALCLLKKDYRPYYLYRQRDILGGLENIGYTLPGFICRYNIAMIEERHHILGLGCGASSKLIKNDLTLTNLSSPKNVRVYLDRLEHLIERRGRELSLPLKQ